MRIISVVAAVALATSLSLPAAADGWGGWKHGWRHHHHHHGWRHHHHHHRHGGVGVFLDFRPAPRYVYRSSPDVIVVERPVVIERRTLPPGSVLGPEVADRSARHCREFRTTGRIAGKVEELWGVACRNPDGSWEFAG